MQLTQSSISASRVYLCRDSDDGMREHRLVLLSLFLFLLFNILTATLYPFPHVDEAMISEPAINFVHGLGFHVRFSEILVLYPFLLVPWLKIFGTSLEAIRSANAVCMTAALYVLWSAVKRLDIISGTCWRLLMLGLLGTEYGMIFAYRSGRYDSFGTLLIASGLWVMSIQKRRVRLIGVAVISLLLPWAGPQYLPLLFVSLLLLVLFFGREYWQEIAASLVAAISGGVIFLSVVWISGRMGTFLKFAGSQQRSISFLRALIEHGNFNHGNYIPKDPSFLCLFGAALLLFFSSRRKYPGKSRRVLSFGILFAVILTVVMLGVAKFPSYYSYMVVVPVSIGLCSGLASCKPSWVRGAVLLLCVLSAGVGAALNVSAYFVERHDHEYARIEKFVGRTIRPGDVAYVEPVAYVATRSRAHDAYFPNPDLEVIPLMSQQQRDSVDVVLTRPEWAVDILGALGGNWYDTGESLTPLDHGLFGQRDVGFVSWTFAGLRAYRRVGTSAELIRDCGRMSVAASGSGRHDLCGLKTTNNN